MSEKPGKKPPVLGSAPRAKDDVPTGPAEPQADPRILAGSAGPSPAQTLVDQLVQSYASQVRRSLGVELDGSTTSLAFVDHHLAEAREEDRTPIVALVAAGAGAYFGELIRREIGATWIGDGEDPRRLRLLLTPVFLHFSPVDQAYEAIASESLDPEDPRIAPGPAFDPAFHLHPPWHDERGQLHDEQAWLTERLAELSPVPEDQYYSLTCRFETLELMLQMLATLYASEGRTPRQYTVEDYAQALAKTRGHA